jgi:UDP-galactopyranose mutase
MNYDSIVIGSGVAGSVIARSLADQGKKVLVLEKRHHIGGNCYDEFDEHGVLIHTYGPHIFHTSKKHVFDYLSRFTKWYEFGHQVVANIHGTLMPIPFNLNTLHMVYNQEKADELEAKLIATFGKESRVPILKLRESNDPDIQEIAEYVYQNVFLKYTMKQWGQTPEEIDPAVTGRVPVLVSYDNRYFQEPYQGMPLNGFTEMFENMLDHENITIKLNSDAKALMQIDVENRRIYFENNLFTGDVIYTGALDELFDCRFGRLPYRSLNFTFEHYPQDDFQGHSVVNYTVSEDYTRITEFKHLTGQQISGTTIMKEYPFAYSGKEGEIPYYAIANDENHALYHKYANLVQNIPNFHLLGRLAEYKYYNIDAMCEKALELAEKS